MKIMVDIDETLNDLIETILPIYNTKYQDNVTINDITEYNIHKFLKPECSDIFKEFMTDSLIENLQVNRGAVEALTELSKDNDIYFLTSAHPKSVLPKHKWLQKHFPFYHSDRLIICHDKGMVKGDIIIDDCVDYLKNSSCLIKILFRKPWNRGYMCDKSIYGHSMSSWTEFPKIYENILTYLSLTDKLRKAINYNA